MKIYTTKSMQHHAKSIRENLNKEGVLPFSDILSASGCPSEPIRHCKVTHCHQPIPLLIAKLEQGYPKRSCPS